jgi:hypothetical protein
MHCDLAKVSWEPTRSQPRSIYSCQVDEGMAQDRYGRACSGCRSFGKRH